MIRTSDDEVGTHLPARPCVEDDTDKMASRLKTMPGSPASWPRSAWAILTAILVALLTLFGGGERLNAAYESFTQTDRIIEISSALSNAAERSVPVTLIKIDDETMARWGGPLITPHAALARLIEIAGKGGAPAIVVDVILLPTIQVPLPTLPLSLPSRATRLTRCH